MQNCENKNFKSGCEPQTTGDYYVGIDAGTSSLGWAASDTDYNILKFKGNSMWGVRLFDEANDASERRTARTARRLTARRKQRLEWLELIFNNKIAKADPSFFIRLHESALYSEDKTDGSCKYSLFNDADFTDRDYMRCYPTAYHLRNELVYSKEYHDPRLVFLAVHHIIKNRGHFLFGTDDGSGDSYKSTAEMLDELIGFLRDNFQSGFEISNKGEYISVLIDTKRNITDKKKALKDLVSFDKNVEYAVNQFKLSDALAGATVNASDLFCDNELKGIKVELKKDRDTLLGDISELEDDYASLLMLMKDVFDCARLEQILRGKAYICEVKTEMFEENKRDLKKLKNYVKENNPEKYEHIFSEKSKGLNNFVSYRGRDIADESKRCSTEDFCKFLKKELPGLFDDERYSDIAEKINGNAFLPRLRSSDNSVIPNQLQLRELKKILENAAEYLPFLNEKDENGLTAKEKIISIFSFKIPYYVGPLNKESDKSWVVRTDEKIYPWNLGAVVDTKKSAEAFMEKLIGRCTYTGEYVLPKDSLLYSEYNVLNEINPIKVNGKSLPAQVKQQLVKDLFEEQNIKVTKKKIKDYLLALGLINAEDEISGIDDTVKARLKSYNDFKKILDKTHDAELVEEIIKRILVFGDEKKLLKNWLKSNCPQLNENDVKYVCRLKYSGWGRLSREFLIGIYTPDENGEAHSIIDMLRSTDCNLMQLLSDDYKFRENAAEYRRQKFGATETLKEKVDELYVSPKIRRSIIQTMHIVDEIVSIRKAAPKKIFIEVARGTKEDLKGKRTKSRKDSLLELYESCKKEYPDLYEALKSTDETKLRHDALYLYYTQFGRCMYSGAKINIDEIDTKFDVDHIFPQSKIKDDSLNNRVLVARQCNIDKSDKYPLLRERQKEMKPFWQLLKSKGLISEIKYERLVRVTPLTKDELSSFVSRQLVETQQSTKALAQILKEFYPQTKIVYSKAGNVSEFRQEIREQEEKHNSEPDNVFVKCRDLNDLHHAKDAYLNIVVGNVYDTKFTENFFRNIENEEYSLNRIFNRNVKGAWDVSSSLKTVKSVMKKNNIIVTRRSYEAKGALFDLNIMPKGKGQLPIKQGKGIEKYGGYNKVKGAYFFVVEHLKKGKRVRSVEPVYIYNKTLYEQNPVKYCETILGLSEPVVIYPKLRMDSLLEIDGKRIYITGRSNGSFQPCKHAYQLCVSPDAASYIKKISKYLDRCTKANAREEGLHVTSYDGINAEDNARLLKIYIKKLETPAYGRLFSAAYKSIKENENAFYKLSLYKQCFVLNEILKLFKCDAQSTDLRLIGGVKTAGVISQSMNISGAKSAVVINHSPTGLFETRVDLLK